MKNTRKQAFSRFKELKNEKMGITTINTSNVKNNISKSRVRTDELYLELQERSMQLIEDKMLDLSRWSGEGSLHKYADLVD
jgi:hypothetical protein